MTLAGCVCKIHLQSFVPSKEKVCCRAHTRLCSVRHTQDITVVKGSLCRGQLESTQRKQTQTTTQLNYTRRKKNAEEKLECLHAFRAVTVLEAVTELSLTHTPAP